MARTPPRGARLPGVGGYAQVMDVIDAADGAGTRMDADQRAAAELHAAEPHDAEAHDADAHPPTGSSTDGGPADGDLSPDVGAVHAETPASDGTRRSGCTSAQMRRFIKSRPYIPMHELRRRFQIEGGDDEVHGFEADGRIVFVGLPERESAMLGELVRQGEVGFELLLDPTSPLVVGVFPMRPVPHS